VFLSALAVGSARAGDVYSQAPDGGVRPHACAEGQSCAHISGYIKARSDAVSGPPPLMAPPPLAAIGFGMNAVGQATSNALNHGMGFMRTSGGDDR
jgi:hypothetical protein